MTFAHTARNQHGEVIATATRKTLVRMRPAVSANESAGSPTRAAKRWRTDRELDTAGLRLAVLSGRSPER